LPVAELCTLCLNLEPFLTFDLKPSAQTERPGLDPPHRPTPHKPHSEAAGSFFCHGFCKASTLQPVHVLVPAGDAPAAAGAAAALSSYLRAVQPQRLRTEAKTHAKKSLPEAALNIMCSYRYAAHFLLSLCKHPDTKKSYRHIMLSSQPRSRRKKTPHANIAPQAFFADGGRPSPTLQNSGMQA
jgi:hypothetical protein